LGQWPNSLNMYDVQILTGTGMPIDRKGAIAFHREFSQHFNKGEPGQEDYMIAESDPNCYEILIMLDTFPYSGQRLEWLAAANWLRRKGYAIKHTHMTPYRDDFKHLKIVVRIGVNKLE